jgi:hypothetical protein
MKSFTVCALHLKFNDPFPFPCYIMVLDVGVQLSGVKCSCECCVIYTSIQLTRVGPTTYSRHVKPSVYYKLLEKEVTIPGAITGLGKS